MPNFGRILTDIAEELAPKAERLAARAGERVAPRAARKVAREIPEALTVRADMPLFPGYAEAHRNVRLGAFTHDTAAVKPRASSRDVSPPEPLRLYHATRGDFNQFETGRPTKNYYGDLIGDVDTTRHANFFAEDPAMAENYIRSGVTGEFMPGGHVMPVYVSARRPFDMSDAGLSQMLDDENLVRLLEAKYGISIPGLYQQSELERWDAFDRDEGLDFVNNLQRAGYDSAFLREPHPETGDPTNVWAVFQPTQIKSAIGNRGSFDPFDPDITKARGGLAVKKAKGGGAWTRKEGQNPEGGLNAKGRASLKAQGHDIKPPVSAKQAKKSPKAAARRKSFCARMSGMPGALKDDKGRPTRKALALRKWDC